MMPKVRQLLPLLLPFLFLACGSAGAQTVHRPLSAYTQFGPPVLAPAPAVGAGTPNATVTQLQAQISSLQARLNADVATQSALVAQAQSQNTASQAQIAASQAQITALNAQISTLTAQVKAKAAAAAPVALGQPYTNTTGRLLTLHHQLSCIAYGNDGTGAGSVAGYYALIQEAYNAGADCLFLDDGGGTDPNYTHSRLNLYIACNQFNTQNGWGPGQTGGVISPKGVGKFSLYEGFDFSNAALETTAAMVQVLSPILHDPANLTINGRPVYSCYVGGGGRPWASLAAIFQPVNAQLTVGGIKPYVIWGGEPTNPDGSASDGSLASLTAWANGCVKPFADAVWQFPSGNPPTGPQSGIPFQETLAQAVHAAGLAFQSSLNPQYGQISSPSERFFCDFSGGEGLHAYWRSILDVQKPDIGVQIATGTDPAELSNVLSCNIVPGQPVWVGFPHFDVSGYYKSKLGILADLDNYEQEMKTGVKPVYTTDRLCAWYITQTGPCLNAPTNDPLGGILAVVNENGSQSTATAPQYIYVSVYASAFCAVTATISPVVPAQVHTNLAVEGDGTTIYDPINPFTGGEVGETLQITGGARFTPGNYVVTGQTNAYGPPGSTQYRQFLILDHSPGGNLSGGQGTFYPAGATLPALPAPVVTLTKFVPPGQSFLRFPASAGIVGIQMTRNGATVLTLTGEPILSTAAVADPCYYTMTAHN